MKKMFVTLLALSMAAGVFANGSKETAPAQAAEEKPMTQEEIIAAAKQEGDLTIYTPSSRHSQMGEQFGAQYGLKVTTTQLKDIEMVEKVSQEAKANLDGADVVFAQDGARVYPELIATGYVTSYTPDDLKSKIPAMYQNPQVWDLCVKAFVYNNETAGQPITNVWQLTEPEWSGRVQMKDAYSEAVNMNFFTMITRDDWAKKISDAYKHLYGKDEEREADEYEEQRRKHVVRHREPDDESERDEYLERRERDLGEYRRENSLYLRRVRADAHHYLPHVHPAEELQRLLRDVLEHLLAEIRHRVRP